jgi:hypothetical protein
MSAATRSGFFPSFSSHRASFAHDVVFPEPLQADHHDPCGPGGGPHDGLAVELHHRDHLVVADLDEVIARGGLVRARVGLHLGGDRLAEGLLLHAAQEGLHDADLDVRFEEAEAHLAQRGVDVALGQLGEAGEAVSGLAEAPGDRLEHGMLTDTLAEGEGAAPDGVIDLAEHRAAQKGGDKPNR